MGSTVIPLWNQHTDDVRRKIVIFLSEIQTKLYSDSGKVRLELALRDHMLDMKPWSIGRPWQYFDLTYRLRCNGAVLDEVRSYTALVDYRTRGNRIEVNYLPCYYFRMVLAQGYYPESGLTPKNDEELLRDVLLIKEMGFNVSFDLNGISTMESTIDLAGANANQLGWAGVGQYTVLANPYHMMCLMGAIANGGEYVQPRLTQGADLLGEITGGSRQLVSSGEASQLKELLRSNVEYYYGDYLFPDGMNVCAKTGTGEVGEDKGPNCWMVGFCDSTVYPYAFAVVVEDGSGGIESAGSVVSAVLSALA